MCQILYVKRCRMINIFKKFLNTPQKSNQPAASANNAIITTIKSAWGWSGLEPQEVINKNAFGNFIVADTQGAYWRIMPEEISCTIIAKTAQEFEKLLSDKEFTEDWEMKHMVQLAYEKLGPLENNRVYYFKLSPALGGTYTQENIEMISVDELLAMSGDIAEQVKNLPDGAQIKLKVSD